VDKREGSGLDLKETLFLIIELDTGIIDCVEECLPVVRPSDNECDCPLSNKTPVPLVSILIPSVKIEISEFDQMPRQELETFFIYET